MMAESGAELCPAPVDASYERSRKRKGLDDADERAQEVSEFLVVVSAEAVVLCAALGCGAVDLHDVLGGETATSPSRFFCGAVQLQWLTPNRRRRVESYLRTSLPVLDEVEACVCPSVHRRRRRASPDARVARIYLLPPHPGVLHFALCFASARRARWEMVRQYRIRCQMAVVQTMGGGWASVKNAKEALKCSLQLFGLAVQLGDEATKRKCRVFVGWALLWEHQRLASIRAERGHQVHDRQRKGSPAVSVGARTAAGGPRRRGNSAAARVRRAEALLGEALRIFEQQMVASEHECDESNRNRCFAALYHWSFLSSQERADGSVTGESSDVVQREDRAVDAECAETLPPIRGEDDVDASNDVFDEWSHVFQ